MRPSSVLERSKSDFQTVDIFTRKSVITSYYTEAQHRSVVILENDLPCQPHVTWDFLSKHGAWGISTESDWCFFFLLFHSFWLSGAWYNWQAIDFSSWNDSFWIISAHSRCPGGTSELEWNDASWSSLELSLLLQLPWGQGWYCWPGIRWERPKKMKITVNSNFVSGYDPI